MNATVPQLAARALRRLGVVAVDATERPSIADLVSADVLARRALEWIGVVASGEAAEVADTAAAVAKVRAVNEQLVAAGIASWSEDAIPLAVSEEIVMLTAMHLGPMFGKAPADPAAREAIEGRIRRAVVIARAQTDAEHAVQDVHAALSARGKARWTLFDIPDYAEGPYVAMAANLLAPQFGMQADEIGQVRAERQLTQAIALQSAGEISRHEYF